MLKNVKTVNSKNIEKIKELLGVYNFDKKRYNKEDIRSNQ